MQPSNKLFDMLRSMGRAHAAVLFGKNSDAVKQIGDDLVAHAIKGLGTKYTKENHQIATNKLKEILTKVGYEKPTQIRERLDTAGFDPTDYKTIITNLDNMYSKDGYKKNLQIENTAEAMGIGFDAIRQRNAATMDLNIPADNDSARIRPQNAEPVADTAVPAVSKPDSASPNVLSRAKKEEPQQAAPTRVTGFQKQPRDVSKKKSSNVNGF